MKLISYAQNREDILLWRALGHVEHGFYIDVGANHPDDDSVTRLFYDRDWHGINIEPLAAHIAQLNAARPRDLNLQCAAGAEAGFIELFDTSVRGLATAAPAVAEQHRRAGLDVSVARVPVRRLDDICAEHVRGPIHFLKVDVEGFEESVLLGMDWQRYRPWIVVVEATRPNSSEINTDWEYLLLDASYQYVYFDGLNRYYAAAERSELAAAFAAPPNVFDGYVPIEIERLGLELAAEKEVNRRQMLMHDVQLNMLAALADQAWGFEQRLLGVYASTSWRVTGPLRRAMRLLQTGKQALAPTTAALKLRCLRRVQRLLQPLLTRLEGDRGLRQRFGRLARQIGLHQFMLAHWWRVRHAIPVPIELDAAGPVRMHPSVLPAHPTLPEAAAVDVPNNKHWIRLVGHIEGHYSLAIINRGLAVALQARDDVDLSYVPRHGEIYSNPVDLPLSQRDVLLCAINAQIPEFALQQTISITHHYPLVPDSEPSDWRLAIFFWEETAVPASTIVTLNAGFDAVLAASHFVKRALFNSGCRIPVFVIPTGLDHLIDADESPIASLLPAPGQPARLLHVSSAFERKGLDVLLQAYFEQFSAADSVELYIKTFANPHNNVQQQVADCRAGRADAPRVIIDEQPLDDAGMLALYRSAQLLVLPTRGEGFNLPAAEALALGLPLIVSGHGGHADFCTRETAALIPFHFAPSRSHVRSADSCWVEPDPAALGRLLRHTLEQIEAGDALLEARRQTGIRHVRQTYTWQHSADAVLSVVQQLQHRRRAPDALVSPRVAVVSPWASHCGIAEYSSNLLQGLIAGNWTLDIYCDARTAAATGYEACWTVGDADSVAATLQRLRATAPDVVIVQHQPSLFELSDAVCAGLDALRAAGSVVVLELHSTLPLLAEHRLPARRVDVLRRLDRLVVHKVDDLNNLLGLGLVDNVLLLAHGVVSPLASAQADAAAVRAELGIPVDAVVLGGFGFALEHKGIDTVIASLPPLAKALGSPVYYLGVHAVLDRRSEQEQHRVQALAHRLGVADFVIWIGDYRPIEECQRLLGAADYVAYAYRNTRESVSGAATIGLATLRPVLVTALPIFEDVADVTWPLADGTPAALVDAIKTLRAQPALVQSLLERQQNWLAERSWSGVAARFAALVQALVQDRQLSAHSAAESDEVAVAPRSKQLLVDISDLYARDSRTGIQRVVRSILGALLKQAPAGYEVHAVYGEPGIGYRYAGDFLGTGASVGLVERPLAVREGDIFLGLDLAAHLFPEAETWLQAWRAAGVSVYFVVYDIIPLLHPEYMMPGINHAFERWLHGLARQADGLLCISAAVADDVRHWLDMNVSTLPWPEVCHFHLGADIENSRPTSGLPVDAEQTLSALRAAPTFLMVGTIEPRKGHMQALAAFDQLWRDGCDAQLAIVGKQGWMMEDFARQLRQHPEFGRRLFWLEGGSDEYLEHIYRASTCLLAASYTEGFGLPLIEAARRQLPILARNIPVFREVAGSHAFYFSGQRPADLAAAVQSWLQLDRQDAVPRSTSLPWLTWTESCEAVLSAVMGSSFLE